MSSGNRSNWGKKNWDRNQRGGRGRGGFGGRDRGSRGGVNKNFRGHNFGNNRGFRGRGDQNFQIWSKTPRDSPGKRLSEEEIGVTEYVNDHEGFLGVIKSRYSDFQVSEINLKGEIAKLTDMKPPEPPVNKDVEEDEDLLLNKYNVELLPMEVWDRINKLVVSDAGSEKVEVDVTGMSKEQRTKIHDAVKKAFGDSIVGSTVGDDSKKMVRFEKYRKGGWLPSTSIGSFTHNSKGQARTTDNKCFKGAVMDTHPYRSAIQQYKAYRESTAFADPLNTYRVGTVSTASLYTRRDRAVSTVTSRDILTKSPDEPTSKGWEHCKDSALVEGRTMPLCDRVIVPVTSIPSSALVHSRTKLVGRVAGPVAAMSGLALAENRTEAFGKRLVGSITSILSSAQVENRTEPSGVRVAGPVASTLDLSQVESRNKSSGRTAGSVTLKPGSAQAEGRTGLLGDQVTEPVSWTLGSAQVKSRTQPIVTEPDASIASSALIKPIDSRSEELVSDSAVPEQIEPRDSIFARLEAGWTLHESSKKKTKPLKWAESKSEGKIKKKNKKQRRKARENAELALKTTLHEQSGDLNTTTIVLSPCLERTVPIAEMPEGSVKDKGKEVPVTVSRKRIREDEAMSLSKKNIKKVKRNNPLTAVPPRLSSDNEIMSASETKRQKPESTGVNIAFDQAMKEGLVVSITTVSGIFSPQLSEEFQVQTQRLLVKEALQPNNQSAGPMFRGKPIYSNGALRLWCEDETTLAWLKRCASIINLSTGDKLVVKPQSDVTRGVRCGILFPGIWEDFSKVARTLRYQNSWAGIDSWVLHKVDRQNTDTFAIVGVPEAIVQVILERRRRLVFMLGSVYVKFQGPRGKFVEYPPGNVVNREIDTPVAANAICNKEAAESKALESLDQVERNNEDPRHLESEENSTELGDVSQENEGMPTDEGIPCSHL